MQNTPELSYDLELFMFCRCDGGEFCSPSGVCDTELEDLLWMCGFLGSGTDDPRYLGVPHLRVEVPYYRDLSLGSFHAVFMVVSINIICVPKMP